MPAHTRAPFHPLGDADIRTVDIDAPLKQRMNQLIANDDDLADLKQLAQAGAKLLKPFDPLQLPSNLAYHFLFAPHGKYMDECEWVAARTGHKPHIIAALQRLYSLSKLSPGAPEGEAGCTAAPYYYHPSAGMYLARCLDWTAPGEALAAATRIVHYTRGGDLKYKAVQALGMTGHLSILKPGKFAIAINWAPEHGLVGVQTEPTHRLREIAEDDSIQTFEQAIEALTDPDHDIAADTFFTVVGVESKQMCVIERQGSSDRYHRRNAPAGMSYLVQANHYDPQGRFKRHPANWVSETLPAGEDGYDLPTSQTTKARQLAMEAALASINPAADPVTELHRCLENVPVRNSFTRQQMVFHVQSGHIHAWRQ